MGNNSQHDISKRFNQTIGTWIAYLDDYTLDMLCQRPAEGAWSLGRMYLHLIDDTHFYVGQMKTALTNTDHSDGKMSESAKIMLVNNAFPDALLTNPSNTPDGRQPASKAALAEGLLAIQAEVNGLLSAHDFTAAKGKAEHPGFRYLSALEWLQFAEMHLRHHFRQKERIDATLFF